MTPYRGRFAPSPTGPLHAGSLVAALASWLDATAHHGTWVVRIEDVDTPRTVPGSDSHILQQLLACGLVPHEPVVWQSQRSAAYAHALASLQHQGVAYACTCSRQTIAQYWAQHGVVAGAPHVPHTERPYPGTCRAQPPAQPLPAHAWRLAVAHVLTQHHLPSRMVWHDRQQGEQSQRVEQAVGDFVLQRADDVWAYQLAVVVDDAWQGITHVVRGLDLADNTPRQRVLQVALRVPTPAYLHTPLVCDDDGRKLSKQQGASGLDVSTPALAAQALSQAAQVLGLPAHAGPVSAALATWVPAWAAMHCLPCLQ